MKIETEITLDDLVAFNRYHTENSRFVKRRGDFVKYSGYGVALFAIFSASISIFRGNIQSCIINILFAIVFLIITGSKFRQYFVDIYARGIYKEGKNKGLLGHHEITIRDDVLFEETDSGTSAVKWHSVEKVVKTDKYIFVYVTSLSACVIPRRDFVNDNAYAELYKLMLSKKEIASQSNSSLL